MINNLKENRVTFEVAKLLKTKGFEVPTHGSYTQYLKSQKSDNPSFKMTKGELEDDSDFMINNNAGDYSCESFYQCSKPTNALVIEWIRENFGYNIYVKWGYSWEYHVEKKEYANYHDGTFNSYADAEIAGIDYVLKQMI